MNEPLPVMMAVDDAPAGAVPGDLRARLSGALDELAGLE